MGLEMAERERRGRVGRTELDGEVLREDDED